MAGGIVPGMADKVRENRLRRMAERQGLVLTRSRRRDPRALDYGLYWLARTKGQITDSDDSLLSGVTLDEVEAYLTREPRQ